MSKESAAVVSHFLLYFLLGELFWMMLLEGIIIILQPYVFRVFLVFFRAAPLAKGGSQARGQIRATFFILFYFILFFPAVQHGGQVILTCIHFPPHPLFCCNMSI